jgi:uncharacterized protein YegJ (DUF2314 family)
MKGIINNITVDTNESQNRAEFRDFPGPLEEVCEHFLLIFFFFDGTEIKSILNNKVLQSY